MIILNLIQNVALLLALVAAHQIFAGARLKHRLMAHPIIPVLLSGLAFGALGILGMLTPVHFAPGVFLDGRSIILAVAGLTGGPVVAAVAALMCGACRLWLGGAGIFMGIAVIVESAALGVCFFYLRRRYTWLMRNSALWGFGLLVHLLMLVSMMLLPQEIRWEVLHHIGLPVLLVYPLATVVVCRLFFDQENRAKTEAALHEGNQLLALFMRHSPIYAFIKSVTPDESRVLQASDNFKDMVGISGSAMAGKTMQELFPADFAKKITDDDWAVVSSGEVLKITEELNGRSYTTIKFPIVQGGKTLLAGYTIDITDQKRAEDALRDAHERLQRFVDANIVGVIIADPTGRIVEANDYYLDLLGFSRQEFDAGSVDWRSLTPAEWLPADERAIQELRERGRCTPYEKEYLRRDGAKVPVLLADVMLPGPAERIVAFVLDLTGLKRAEQGLREAEWKFHALFEKGPIGVAYHEMIHDDAGNPVDYRFIDANESYIRLTGVDPRGKTVREAFPGIEKDPFDWIGTFARVVRTGEEMRFEQHLQFNDCWYDCVAYRYGPNHFVVAFLNTTERKRAEEGLRLKNLVFDASIAANSIADVHGLITEANNSFLKVWGYDDKQEVLGKDIRDFLSDPDEAVAIVETLNRTGEWEGDYTAKRKNGSTFTAHGMATVVRDESEGIVGYQSAVVDVTDSKRAAEALRESEERYREFVENANSIILRMDMEGNVTFFNEFALRFFGYRPEEILGHNVVGTIVPETDSAGRNLRAMITDICHRPERHSVNENENMLRDGTRVWVAWTNKPLLDAGGRVVGVLSVGSDITELKRAATEREALEAQLQQSQKMESVGRLAGGVAHDFNNMLGVILGFTEMALLQVDPGRQLYADLEEIQKAANRSADLTRQLLAFARRQTVTPELLNLNEVVPGLLKMLKRLLGENIVLEWEPGQELWTVRMDPSQIDQILANLCVNARDAIADVGCIRICTENRAVPLNHGEIPSDVEPGDYVVLSVSDNGCGMDDETLSHIFEPFYTTKEVGKGTGLGLATVYGIVRQNNGFINVRSAVGEGAAFEIYLPRHARDVEQPPSEIMPAPVQRGRETILLVEDEPAFLRLTKRLLERLGYSVLAASSPGAAIRLAREHKGEIALLMTDVVMPEMNGRELARTLLSLYPKIRRLFMSGYTADVIAHQGVLDGGTRFIQKPFTPNELAVKVREALDD